MASATIKPASGSQLVAVMTGWFGRFPAETTAVEDTCLLTPHRSALSNSFKGEE